MKVLIIGDIFGKPGRQAVAELLPNIKLTKNIDLCIANAENSAGGSGLTQKSSSELFKSGVDLITLGNHTWAKSEIKNFIDDNHKIIRPLNYPKGTLGKGSIIVNTPKGKVGVVNLLGRVFMDLVDCPFSEVKKEIELLKEKTSKILIDFHAEATSEKVAMGYFLDGQVSAVVGTHTHIQTADEKILPYGTAYITDIGMTGPSQGVLGVDKDIIVSKFTTSMPKRFEVASGDIQMNAVIVEINDKTGKASKIERINQILKK